MVKLSSKNLKVDPEKDEQRALDNVDSKTRLFTLLDALLCPHVDGDPLIGKLLKGLGVTSSDTSWSANVTATARGKIASRGGPYKGDRNHDMIPEQRFLLCDLASRSPETRLPLQRLCVKKEVLEKPLGMGLAQVFSLFQNKEKVFQDVYRYAPRLWERRIHLALCTPSVHWFDERTPFLQSICLADMLVNLCFEDVVHPLLGHAIRAWKEGRVRLVGSNIIIPLAMYYVWSGEMAKAEEYLARAKVSFGESAFFYFALGFLQLFQGNKACLQTLEKGYALFKKERGIKDTAHLGLNIGLARNLARFLYGETSDIAAMNEDLECLLAMQMESLDEVFFGRRGFCALRALSFLRDGKKEPGEELLKTYVDKTPVHDENALSSLVYLGAVIRFGLVARRDVEEIKSWYERTKDLPLFNRCFADLMYACSEGDEKEIFARQAKDSFANIPDFSCLVRERKLWEIQLEALEKIFCEDTFEPKREKKREVRLVWEADVKKDSLTPIEQVLQDSGKWSKGRSVALKRLSEEGHAAATFQDLRIISRIEHEQGWSQTVYRLSLKAAAELLEGHPLVFVRRNGELEQVSVRKEGVELFLSEDERNYTLKLRVPELVDAVSDGNMNPCFEKEKEIVVCHLSRSDVGVVSTLGESGMEIPKAEGEKLFSMMQGKNALPVQAANIKVETIQANPYPVLQLEHLGSGIFSAKIGVRPFTAHGTPFFPVGYGLKEPLSALPLEGESLYASHLTRPVRTVRDFEKENMVFRDLAVACPALEGNLEGLNWQSENIEDTISLLEQLKDSSIPNTVEWPKGGGIKFSRTIQSADVSLKAKKGTGSSGMDWFSVSGEIQIEEDRFISVRQMLDALKDSRFVKLGDGDYAVLTEDLRRKLKRLQFIGESKKDGIKVSPLALDALDGIFDGMDFKADKHWQQMASRMKAAFAANPKVPALLQADLREYQKEGYQWMQRLAIWGMGACLADDMGLGKTVQTIAVMLNQAAKGPCLVIAPTSVCGNWELEIQRFAPSLTTHRLGTEDRLQAVSALGKNDVLVLGYGLLVNVEKEISSVHWSMVVFDEAQALKNAATKRARVGSKIPADFRVALTGTPIENRIDDLWSLFNTINPGLLGSWEGFRKRFGEIVPGSGGNRALRALIRPFLLRRLKSAVLEELPSRTEQTILIEPNEKEHVFYESMRRKFVDKFEVPAEEQNSRRFQILAALSKLRMTCCHPGLAEADMGAMEEESSKTEYFVDMVGKLIANGHKVLAFSQFTSYLAIIQKALEKRKISYKYLDGSTPEKERKQRVAAFQAGEGDVFLLSLKAGGTGINLTAADYVVHLDPWWNPAVEDQASDRAHRMGQKRPVTIYRLAMAHSVEEKILALHAAKRGLAADFLEGTETSVKSLSEEELFNLLQA